MKMIFLLSLRNLMRHKRRTILLGSAIAFGMMILMVANSFSRGLSDNLLNKMIVNMTGHMEISLMEKSKPFRRVIRDKDRFIRLIKSEVKDIKEIRESVATITRVIGLGKSDNSFIVGYPNNKDASEYLKSYLIKGDIKEFYSGKKENPIILYDTKAKSLNVKVNDTVKARLTTISGQIQSARFTVVGILRSSNMIESFVMYLNLPTMKRLIDMKPHETGALQVNFNRINNPRFAIREAEKLHKTLKPGKAVIYSSLSNGNNKQNATVLGFFNNENELDLLKKNIKIIKGSFPGPKDEKAALVSSHIAKRLRIKTGDTFKSHHELKFGKKKAEREYTVWGIFKTDKIPTKNIVLLNETVFYKMYLEDLPLEPVHYKNAYVPKKGDALYTVFSPEWQLLERSSDSQSMRTKLMDMRKTRWKGPWLDVRTMYESASRVLDLEFALNLISLFAVLILFFIILIGVINTLRMTIRERTREIGTIRAIGMQKRDVRDLFMTETILLSFFSSVAGIILAFIIMKLTGLISINSASVFSLLLVDKHLYFLPTAASVFRNLVVIIIISGVTAYFPSKRAASLSAAAALRHYE
ncbi:FtsX-like permease family protein [Spirochaetota bacterium]